jgi:hypothetical protein
MKTMTIQIRIEPEEKQAFEEAAEIAGIGLSAWVRERLRASAIRELEGVGRAAAFVQSVPIRGGKNV